jgi:hypothetical protein
MIDSDFGALPLGEALYDSKSYVHHNFGWDHYLEYQNMQVYNFYGDPSMMRQGTKDGGPYIPVITGPQNGNINTEYTYKIETVDATRDDIYYYIDWGDDTSEEWIGPYTSGEEVVISHTWEKKGEYAITVKAKDTDEKESETGTLPVIIPKGRFQDIKTPIISYLSFIAEKFPFLQLILEYII